MYGGQLAKLLLALGRIMGVMAAFPEGHAPEMNQFVITNRPGGFFRPREADDLLTAAVMHLAIARHSGSKLGNPGETHDWDYAIYPIFAPFFNFSYRRKRKMHLTPEQLVALIHSPRTAINQILDTKKLTPDETLPDQLRLFEAFYAQPD